MTEAAEIVEKIEMMIADMAALPASKIAASQVILDAVREGRVEIMVSPEISELEMREIRDAIYVLRAYQGELK